MGWTDLTGVMKREGKRSGWWWWNGKTRSQKERKGSTFLERKVFWKGNEYCAWTFKKKKKDVGWCGYPALLRSAPVSSGCIKRCFCSFLSREERKQIRKRKKMEKEFEHERNDKGKN